METTVGREVATLSFLNHFLENQKCVLKAEVKNLRGWGIVWQRHSSFGKTNCPMQPLPLRCHHQLLPRTAATAIACASNQQG